MTSDPLPTSSWRGRRVHSPGRVVLWKGRNKKNIYE